MLQSWLLDLTRFICLMKAHNSIKMISYSSCTLRRVPSTSLYLFDVPGLINFVSLQLLAPWTPDNVNGPVSWFLGYMIRTNRHTDTISSNHFTTNNYLSCPSSSVSILCSTNTLIIASLRNLSVAVSLASLSLLGFVPALFFFPFAPFAFLALDVATYQ